MVPVGIEPTLDGCKPSVLPAYSRTKARWIVMIYPRTVYEHHMQGHDPWARLCGKRESNPPLNVGNVLCHHNTSTAKVASGNRTRVSSLGRRVHYHYVTATKYPLTVSIRLSGIESPKS